MAEQSRRGTETMGPDETLVFDAVSLALAKEDGKPMKLKRKTDTMILPEAADAARKAIEAHRSATAEAANGTTVAAIEDEATPEATEKTITDEEQAGLFALIESRLKSDPDRYEGDAPARIMQALASAPAEVIYGLIQMEENGHQVGVTMEERNGKKGFRFDSCSKSSPDGIRNMDHGQADDIVKGWGADLMDPAVFNQLLNAGIITERGTWSHLKTDAKTLASRLSWYGRGFGTSMDNADFHFNDGGFRCSLWIPEV